MNRLDILNYIYAINDNTGVLKKVIVEEYSTIRNYTMVFVENRGLVAFKDGKPTNNEGVTYYLKPEYIKQQFFAKASAFAKDMENLKSNRDYYLRKYENCVSEINELERQKPENVDIQDLIHNEKEIISAYHKNKQLNATS